MNNFYYEGYVAACVKLGLAKIAASRLDKEVLEGNVGYHDVDPRLPASMGQSGMGKGFTRMNAMAPAEQTPEAVARLRALRAAKDRNTYSLADKARQTIEKNPEDLGNISNEVLDQASIHNQMFPGAGPATVPMHGAGNRPGVFAGDDSGQFLRSMQDGPYGAFRADLSTKDPTNLAPIFLNPRKSVDDSLNHGVLEHEIGERNTMLNTNPQGRSIQHAHATHAGIEPLLREELAVQGDPEAVRTLQNLRQGNPDDRLTAALRRRAGAHPDSPLPLGGRQQRAVEKMMRDKAHLISKPAQARAAGQQFMTEIADEGKRRLPADHVLQEMFAGLPRSEQMLLPQHIRDATRDSAGHLGELGGKLMNAKAPTSLREAVGLAKENYPHLKNFYQASKPVANFMKGLR